MTVGIGIGAAWLAQYLAGALTFQPEILTWAQAMEVCGGDYAKAAKQYPQLREQYVAAERQKEKVR